MLTFPSSPRFLAVYSGLLTVVFALTVAIGLTRGDFSPRGVSAAEGSTSYDQISIHRINIVEPDGMPRLIIAEKAELPGSYFKGKELSRPDRAESAGMLFMNDEGTENGGLIFGGLQPTDGAPSMQFLNAFGKVKHRWPQSVTGTAAPK